MKVNKKYIGLIIGLVCVVICVALMLHMCGSGSNEETGETNQTEESTNQTETTQATEESSETTEVTETTEESTEPTEESTEETTEATTEPTEESTDPTMETVISAPPPSTNNAIGSPGSVGRPDEETTEPTEPKEEVIVPAGQDTNPYAEILREYPSGFESVMVPAKSAVAYALFVNSGAELTIEDADAYVVHNGQTVESVDGVVKLLLTAEKGAPAVIQLGNKAAGDKAFSLSIKDALGEPTNPEIVEKIDELKVKLEEDDKTGYTFQWTALEEGNVSFNVGSITEDVDCDIILTVGELSVSLVQQSQEEVPEVTEPSEETEETEAAEVAEAAEEAEATEGTETTESTEPTEPSEEKPSVAIGVSKDDVLTIQVITLLPEKEESEEQEPAEEETEEPEETLPEEEKLPAAEITLNGTFTPGVNDDKEEQEATKPTEPEESTDPTEETEPGESTEPSESTEPTEGTEPSESTDPTEPSEAPAQYTVTVTDYNGNPVTDVVVKFMKGSTPAAMVTVDEKGTATTAYDAEGYSVELLFPKDQELYYEQKDAVLSKDASSITLQVAAALTGEPEALSVGDAYYVGVGGSYVKMQSNVVNYFLFAPTEAGNYRISTSDPEAILSYWGGNTFFIHESTESTDYANNSFTRNVKESNLGSTYVIGITGAEDCILEITRTGDPILDETDFPITVYEGTKKVTKIADLPSGKSKKYVSLSAETDSIKLVLGNDGYYHVGAADGPIMYMDLSSAAPHVPLYGMMGMAPIGGENIVQHFYDDNGTLIRREQYNTLLKEYASNVDKTYGVYPLTEDLKYMIQQAGERKGWWDVESPNYMFEEVSNLNTEIAWMFACCTVE